MAAASGDVLVLLNDDVVVTEGWLTGMLECLRSAQDVGIVGPMTNRISGVQQVPAVGYSQLEDLDGYADAFRRRNQNRRIECRRIVGFCMMFRKRLIQEIGGLDMAHRKGALGLSDPMKRKLRELKKQKSLFYANSAEAEYKTAEQLQRFEITMFSASFWKTALPSRRR